MLKTKNFIISGSILVFALALAATVYITQNKKLPEIFGYIPTKMDQIMVNWAEKNMRNNTNMLVNIPQAVQQQFQNIKVMIIAQDQTFSGSQIVFLETKSDFSPQEFFKTINPEGETTSTYLRLGDGQYVFAPQEFISTYKKPTDDKALFKQAQLQKYIPIVRRSDMSVLSQNKDMIPLESQYTTLLDGSEYLLMNLSSSPKGKFDFSAYIIFSKPKDIPSTSFKPQFKSLLKDSTIAYLEVGKVLSGLDLAMQQGSGSFQEVLLKQISANNFAIIISKGANMFNIGLTIVADDTSLYDSLQPLVPLLGTTLENLPLLTGSQITNIEQPGKVGYDVTIQGIQKVGIYLEKTKDQTRISIGNPLLEGKTQKLKGYSKDSLAVLYVDMNNLLDIYKQFTNIGLNAGALSGQENLFNDIKDKTLRGEITMEKDSVGIKGSIK